ncbi:hypothetical protein HK103_003697, partial [Boothiomyces macroporosus]
MVIHCSKNGNLDVLLEILDLPAHFHKEKLNIAFVLACREGHLDIVKHFLKLGIDINYRLHYSLIGHNDWSAKSGFIEAARATKIDILELLLKQKGMVIAPTDLTFIYTNYIFNEKVFNLLAGDERCNWYEYDYAVFKKLCLRNFSEIEKLSIVLKDFRNHSKRIFNAIYSSWNRNSTVIWKFYKLLEQDLDSYDLVGKSDGIILEAAKEGQWQVLLKMKRWKIPVMQDTAGEAFIQACSEGQVETAKVLIRDFHVDINYRRPSKESAFIRAGSRAQPSTVALLLSYKELVVEDSDLFLITRGFNRSRYSKNIKIVLGYLMQDSRCQKWNELAFVELCRCGYHQVVQLLLNREYFDHSVNMQNAINAATENGYLAVAKLLIEYPKNRGSINFEAILEIAIQIKAREFIDYLVERSLIDINNERIMALLVKFAVLEDYFKLWRFVQHYGDFTSRVELLLERLISTVTIESNSWEIRLAPLHPRLAFPLLLMSSEDCFAKLTSTSVSVERLKDIVKGLQS